MPKKKDVNRPLFDSLDHLEQLVVGHFDVAGHVPGQVHHGDHGLDALELVPLVALHGQLVLVRWRGGRTQRICLMITEAPSA